MARTEQAYSTSSQAPALQRVWQSMRVMRRFTTADLQTTAEAGETAVLKFTRALHQAGFLRLDKPIVSGRPGSRNVWLLVRDSGPLPPIRREDGSGVYDPNTGIAWGMQGLPMAPATDIDVLARGLASRASDQPLQGGAYE